MTGIFWLASYPKSGNTWMRMALASLRAGGAAVDINRPTGDEDAISASRRHFDRLLDITSSDMTPEEVASLRPDLYRSFAASLAQPAFVKVHEASRRLPDGRLLFPPEATLGVACMLRDPRDVALSLSHHYACGIERAIGIMADPEFSLTASTRSASPHLAQWIGSWSANVASWLDDGPCPPILVRYEEMAGGLAGFLAQIARQAGLPLEGDGAAERAAAATRFEVLRGQEEAHGFRERPAGMARFFRAGTAGQWRTALTPAQAARIERDHGAVMARLGYL
ncbi:MAG: sulfotransferase domain-containing protein [Thalassobaculales bacterium]